jgi:hypothetical protein
MELLVVLRDLAEAFEKQGRRRLVDSRDLDGRSRTSAR